MSWNSLKREGGVGFMKGLQKNIGLTKLDISHNGLKYDGALAVSNMLKKNKVLKYLDISGNNITWQGALLIASGLKANSTLQVLKVGNTMHTIYVYTMFRCLAHIATIVNGRYCFLLTILP
jgi:Ran GTPase-activating protein (RanGAP) involved in mRNA processing and transport